MKLRLVVFGLWNLSLLATAATAQELSRADLERQFSAAVQPFLKRYCLECHNAKRREAELDLSQYADLNAVALGHPTWEIVLERLMAQEMPPADARTQPSPTERAAVVDWIKAFRKQEAQRLAGDPGPVLLRRLSNAEYNYTIRDLTGIDLRPTQEFPIDPANTAGFDNSGESLTMSPALLQKYVEAARRIAEHLVLTPRGISFAPHPVMTDTDRDKYCVRRILDFYNRQPTDHADYFEAAWNYLYRAELGQPSISLSEIAKSRQVSEKYLSVLWEALKEPAYDVGPMAQVQQQWREFPGPGAEQSIDVRLACERLRDDVLRLRRRLEFSFPDLNAAGIHKGSQTFVLWKNRQYASHRRQLNREALVVAGSEAATDENVDLTLPADPAGQALYLESFVRFCDVFPDAFYVSERGRDYLGKPRDEQEKGRLLSAGFHSMMGYFRDDRPLCELILSDDDRVHLDQLWQELDFITGAPLRQYAGFLWFERTDSRYMRDEEFDFARAEDKNAATEALIARLGQVYLAKAVQGGAEGTAVEAIATYFKEINAQIRWVDQARLEAEPVQLQSMLEFAARAYRRPLSDDDKNDLLTYYHKLRGTEQLSHEEALQDLLVSILMSPDFCYRLDLGTAQGPPRPLTENELANRLSYFLWSSLPDDWLLALNDQSGVHPVLTEPRVLDIQVERMLKDDRMRGLAVEFGGQWLDFRQFENHNSVDRQRFPAFTNELRQAMFEEPVRFFLDIVQQDRSVLEFLDGEHTFVNATLARHYGMPTENLTDEVWTRVDRAGEFQRGGLLPMSVFLTQNSPGLRTSPVKRGYWVVRRLLGERIPPPPPNVPELPADESQLGDLTLRELLAKHREHPSCAGCHARFDSFGLVFENYGPIGEWRDKDLGGREVDTFAEFPNGQPGSGVAGLQAYIRQHRQAEFLDNLCRKLLSYGLGRTLLPSDDEVIAQMQQALAQNEYRFSSLVKVIVQSPQFLRKRGDQAFAERATDHE